MSALPEALNTSGDTVPGWYGKVAALGDFAQRRLPSTMTPMCLGTWAWSRWPSTRRA